MLKNIPTPLLPPALHEVVYVVRLYDDGLLLLQRGLISSHNIHGPGRTPADIAAGSSRLHGPGTLADIAGTPADIAGTDIAGTLADIISTESRTGRKLRAADIAGTESRTGRKLRATMDERTEGSRTRTRGRGQMRHIAVGAPRRPPTPPLCRGAVVLGGGVWRCGWSSCGGDCC